MPDRRLAAIMFADIVGYTGMMQRDEQEGLARVERFTQVLEREVVVYGGNVQDVRGDGSLCIFPSTVEALRCALAIQRALREAPAVPLRIGLHLGDIVVREDTIYGDGVNLASRVESIAVAGSVLVTEQVAAQVHNQSEFRLRSLGQVHFKNVAAPLEVFALTNEGLAVPNRRRLRGKLASRKKSRWLSRLAVLFAGLLAAGYWLWSSHEGTDTIPAPLHQERIAVMAFENQTTDPALDAFGRMVSDWLTKGLMETEGTHVVSAANIQEQVATAGVRDLGRPESTMRLGESTGIGVIVGGNYYLLNDSIFINAKILNASDGAYFKVLDLRGPKNQTIQLLDELTQQVLGYWMIKEKSRFLQNPPTLEAYRDYVRAKPFYITDPPQAERLLCQAFRHDSSFYEPLFELYALYGKEGKDSLRQDILAFLGQRQASFTRWERLRYLELKAREARNWLEAAQLAEKHYRLDPSDLPANTRAIMQYNGANYPARALALIGEVDDRFRPSVAELEIDWSRVNEVFAHFRLGHFDRVVEVAAAYDLPKTPDALAVMRLKAMVRLGESDALEPVFEGYVNEGVYSNSGNRTPRGQLYTLLGDALWLYGDTLTRQRVAA